MFIHCLKRTLNTIINISNDSRTKTKRKRTLGTHNLFTDVHTCIFLVNLNCSISFILADDFTNQFFLTNINYIIKTAAVESFCINNRTRNAGNFSFYHKSPPNKVAESSARFVSSSFSITSLKVRRQRKFLSSDSRMIP